MPESDDRDPVDVLAEEFADRLRRGEHPSVSDYAAAHPDHAEQLRDLLPAVAQMEFLKRFRWAAGLAHKDQLPDRFGDFRIVRELGRGGMGVVFEAVQESLGRPVALKVLATHGQLDATRRERFVREAQAAARLHHTNIVPVFGVGEQDGLPYYVMQLIRGRGLHAIVSGWRLRRESVQETGDRGQETVKETGDRRQETENDAASVSSLTPDSRLLTPADGPGYGNWALVAEVGLQAAEALHYAHEQGVLHRDVKPANLILDPAGRVWVADFGLAKLVESRGLTASGDILGTLQYLAPECLSGDSDPRSDVYGLGATLYELLTLEPPYPSDSPARLIKQVTERAPPPPRQLNPAIPRDLETIVLKAMAREPRQRYASARELARDLQAFLEDRPIKARRQSWLDRSVRWCRRNPTVAVLTASTAAALILAAVVGWAGYAAEAARVEEAKKARDEAEEASAKLAANLDLSLAAFEQVFEAAGGNRWGFPIWGVPGGPGGPGEPGRGPGGPGDRRGGGPKGPGGPVEAAASQTAVLEAVLAFYDQFAAQNATNPKLQFEAGKAYRRVGEAQLWLALSWLGNDETAAAVKSAASLRRAAGILEKLTAQMPADENVRVELALTYLNAPWAPAGTFGPDAATSLRRAAELASGVVPDGPWPWPVGAVHLRFAFGYERLRNWPEAGGEYRAAIAALTRTPAGQRRGPVLTDLAFARSGLARVLANDGKLPEAREVLEESVAELRAAADGGFDRPAREWLAGTLRQLASICEKLGDGLAAEQATAGANELREQLKQGGPFGGFGGPFQGGGFMGPKKDGPPKKN